MKNPENVLVSIHIPKTGGLTLLSILQKVYAGRVQIAYKDDRDKTVDRPLCYHGHAVMDKFSDTLDEIPNVKWMTFLRDPLRSAVSLYHFGVKHGTIQDMGLTKWLTGREDFSWPNPPAHNHNRFSKWIARTRASWDRFDIIGITEYFDDSIRFISQELNWGQVKYKSQNVGSYNEPELSDSVIEEFRRLNAGDYQIYNGAIQRLQNQPSDASDADKRCR